MDQVAKFVSSNIVSLIIGLAALVTAFFQWRKSVAEANAFRQQLVSILHHAEGIASELRNIAFLGPDQNQTFSNVNDVRKAVNGAFQNAESLFFGLLETKVGGRSIKTDLDKKYDEWTQLMLEYKMLALKQGLSQAPSQTTVIPAEEPKYLFNDLKKWLLVVKEYIFTTRIY